MVDGQDYDLWHGDEREPGRETRRETRSLHHPKRFGLGAAGSRELRESGGLDDLSEDGKVEPLACWLEGGDGREQLEARQLSWALRAAEHRDETSPGMDAKYVKATTSPLPPPPQSGSSAVTAVVRQASSP